MKQESPVTPTIGRNVLYVLSLGIHAGTVRPAIITRPRLDEGDDNSPVSLAVFADSSDEGAEKHATYASYDPDGTEPGTWHWHAIQLQQPESPTLQPPAALPEPPPVAAVADGGELVTDNLPSAPVAEESAESASGGESPAEPAPPDSGSAEAPPADSGSGDAASGD